MYYNIFNWINFMTYYEKPSFNIYFGTIGKTLGCKYRFTKKFKNEEEAKNFAKNEAELLYYKNEGKYGIPKYSQIKKEFELTGVSTEILYKEHIKDMTRWYVIPTELDSIPTDKLKW